MGNSQTVLAQQMNTHHCLLSAASVKQERHREYARYGILCPTAALVKSNRHPSPSTPLSYRYINKCSLILIKLHLFIGKITSSDAIQHSRVWIYQIHPHPQIQILSSKKSIYPCRSALILCGLVALHHQWLARLMLLHILAYGMPEWCSHRKSSATFRFRCACLRSHTSHRLNLVHLLQIRPQMQSAFHHRTSTRSDFRNARLYQQNPFQLPLPQAESILPQLRQLH